MSEQSVPPPTPPRTRLARMATRFIHSRFIYTAAIPGIADHPASSPRSAGDLTTPTEWAALPFACFTSAA